MSGEKTTADFLAETRCRVLRIPVAIFQSAIMTDPRAVQTISRTIAGRLRQVLADPARAAAAFRQTSKFIMRPPTDTRCSLTLSQAQAF